MKMIDKIRSMSAEAVEAVKWPFRQASISRRFDALADKAEELRLDTEQALLDARKSLTQASDESEIDRLIKKIVELQLDLEAAEKNAAAVKAEKAYEFGDVHEDSGK